MTIPEKAILAISFLIACVIIGGTIILTVTNLG